MVCFPLCFLNLLYSSCLIIFKEYLSHHHYFVFLLFLCDYSFDIWLCIMYYIIGDLLYWCFGVFEASILVCFFLWCFCLFVFVRISDRVIHQIVLSLLYSFSLLSLLFSIHSNYLLFLLSFMECFFIMFFVIILFMFIPFPCVLTVKSLALSKVDLFIEMRMDDGKNGRDYISHWLVL